MIQEEGAERGEGKYWTMIITNASDRVGKKVTINFTKCRQLTAATSASWWVQTCKEREREKKKKTLSSGIIAWQHVQNTNNPLSHRPSHTFRPIFWGQNMEFPEGNPCEFTLKPGEQLETPVVMKQNGRQSLRQSSRVGRVGLALKKLRWQVVF